MKRSHGEIEGVSSASEAEPMDSSIGDSPARLAAARQAIDHYSAHDPENTDQSIDQRLADVLETVHLRANIQSETVRRELRESIQPEIDELSNQIADDLRATSQYATTSEENPRSAERYALLNEVNRDRTAQADIIQTVNEKLTTTSDVAGHEDQFSYDDRAMSRGR
ncbi:MAG: hypothetical protein AAFP80_01735 [Pseudomonadota bacterium]